MADGDYEDNYNEDGINDDVEDVCSSALLAESGRRAAHCNPCRFERATAWLAILPAHYA